MADLGIDFADLRLENPLVASAGPVTANVEMARKLEDAGVGALELDLCCTIPEFTSRYKYAGQSINFYPKLYARLVKSVKDAVSIPVGAKSTVSLYVYPKLLDGLIRTKLANYEQMEALIEEYKRAEAGRSFRAFMEKKRIGLADKLAMPAKPRSWGLG